MQRALAYAVKTMNIEYGKRHVVTVLRLDRKETEKEHMKYGVTPSLQRKHTII